MPSRQEPSRRHGVLQVLQRTVLLDAKGGAGTAGPEWRRDGVEAAPFGGPDLGLLEVLSAIRGGSRPLGGPDATQIVLRRTGPATATRPSRPIGAKGTTWGV
jgi:hypothetical protein